MTSLRPRSLKVTDVNPHLLCVLCGGYYVDATTIIECLHSFCKSCIVRYLETNKYCPICDVQVHKSKPLLNIRSDQTLQAIVYKLVPGLLQRELRCRREFYKNYPDYKPENSEDAGELTEDSSFYLPDEPILIGVQYAESPPEKSHEKRYFSCPAAITIYHLQKLMRAKFNLNTFQKVEFLHNGDPLPEYLSLMDLAYIYHWKRKHSLDLEYRLYECHKKKIKLFHEENDFISEKNKQNIVECEKSVSTSETPTDPPDREVQLQISENGVMSVHSVNFDLSSVNNDVSSKSDDNNPLSRDSLPLKDIQPETIELMKSLENTVTLDFESSFSKSVECSNISSAITTNNDERTSTNIADVKNITKEKSDTPCNSKPAVNLNNAIDLQVSEPPPVSISDTSVSVPKVYPGVVKDIPKPIKIPEPKVSVTEHETNFKISSEKPISTKPSHIRYKTLKSPIKSWNPTIPRSSLMAMKQTQPTNHEKSDSPGGTTSKAAKFFKMRNVPRFLGNPASGVKPMYQVLPGSELNSQIPQTSTSQNFKHSSEVTVMKIDPKTLSPIPVSRSARSPKSNPSLNKLSSSFVCNRLKSSESPLLNCRTPIRNPVNKSSNMSLKSPGQVHTNNVTSNPFMLPSPHMMYSGFPRPFSSVDSPGSRLPTDNQIFRAMSMLCSPSSGFHPSLPPSISMLFNPHHPHHRSSQNEKLNLKYSPSDFHKTISTTTPSVQRVPPSCHTSKHPVAVSHSPIAANDSESSGSSNLDRPHKSKTKFQVEFGNVTGTQESSSPISSKKDRKDNEISILNNGQDPLQNRLEDKNCVPLSNGLSVQPSSLLNDPCRVQTNKNKEQMTDKFLPNKDISIINNEENKLGKSDKNSFIKSGCCSSVN